MIVRKLSLFHLPEGLWIPYLTSLDPAYGCEIYFSERPRVAWKSYGHSRTCSLDEDGNRDQYSWPAGSAHVTRGYSIPYAAAEHATRCTHTCNTRTRTDIHIYARALRSRGINLRAQLAFFSMFNLYERPREYAISDSTTISLKRGRSIDFKPCRRHNVIRIRSRFFFHAFSLIIISLVQIQITSGKVGKSLSVKITDSLINLKPIWNLIAKNCALLSLTLR